jgi:outer membrane receptor protein involved in Fe transport
LHIAYSHQFVQGRGGVTGGLTDFAPPESSDLFFLDHDQRDTLSVGGQVALPWQSSASANIAYGSGFLDGNGPSHLPSHTAADLSLGKSIGERWSVQATTLNVTNHQHLVDNSNTFGGTHYAFPRQVSVQVQYKFKY